MNPSSKKFSPAMINGLSDRTFYVFALAALVGFLSVSIIMHNDYAYAQHSQLFKVIVSVTNNGDLDQHGAIHVYTDGGSTSKWLNDVYFPSKQTVSHTFEFVSSDIPTGTSFTTEVVYGDDIFKRASGINSASNAPETINISIP